MSHRVTKKVYDTWQGDKFIIRPWPICGGYKGNNKYYIIK